MEGPEGVLGKRNAVIRHSRATEVRRHYRLEGAQATLGHARADVTQIYAEKNMELAKRIAREMG